MDRIYSEYKSEGFKASELLDHLNKIIEKFGEDLLVNVEFEFDTEEYIIQLKTGKLCYISGTKNGIVLLGEED